MAKDRDMEVGTSGASVGDMLNGLKRALDLRPPKPVIFVPIT